MAEHNAEQFNAPITPDNIWIVGLLIFIMGGYVFFTQPDDTSLAGSIISFFGGFILVSRLTPRVEPYDEDPGQEPDPERKRANYQEYQALLDGIHQRGSQIHMVFSILIASSILALTPLFNRLGVENTIEFPFNALPLVSLVLIIATILFYVTSIELDKVSWYRINYLEHRLGIEGHRWLRNQASGIFKALRSLIWPFLLSALLTVYTFLTIHIIFIL